MKIQKLKTMKNKTFILIALMVPLLFSCISENKRLAICASCPQLITYKDSVHEVITRHDTTIYITQKGDSIFVPCDSLVFTKVNNVNGIKSTIIKGKKGITFKCEADSLKAIISGLNKTISKVSSHYEVKVIEKKCQLDHVKWYNKFFTWGFFILLIIAALLILIIMAVMKTKVL